MKKSFIAAAASALAITVAAGSAQAAVQVYTFDVVDAAAGLGSGPFGTVTVDDAGGNLAVGVALNGGYEFRYSPDTNHWDLAFSLTSTAFSLSGISSPFFQAAGTSFNDSPFGTFNYAIDCAKGPCTPGWNPGVNPTSMSFTILGAGFGNLATHTYGGKDIYFAADIVSSTGATGNVGATLTRGGGGVPEPATWAMMILGFGAVGVALRRRQALLAA